MVLKRKIIILIISMFSTTSYSTDHIITIGKRINGEVIQIIPLVYDSAAPLSVRADSALRSCFPEISAAETAEGCRAIFKRGYEIDISYRSEEIVQNKIYNYLIRSLVRQDIMLHDLWEAKLTEYRISEGSEILSERSWVHRSYLEEILPDGYEYLGKRGRLNREVAEKYDYMKKQVEKLMGAFIESTFSNPKKINTKTIKHYIEKIIIVRSELIVDPTKVEWAKAIEFKISVNWWRFKVLSGFYSDDGSIKVFARRIENPISR